MTMRLPTWQRATPPGTPMVGVKATWLPRIVRVSRRLSAIADIAWSGS